ncbi:Hsp70-binding protein 1 [Chlorella vulgaris]
MNENAVWKGLFEWSIAQQGDGTAAARPLTEQDRSWLEGALKSAMIDLSKRMQDIKATLDGGEAATAAESDAEPATLQQKEQLLDELMDIVDSIDLARDLHTIGGLTTLLELLDSPHPSLRWRAAEVAATCAQNNPDVQKAFLEGGALLRLLPLLHDADSTVQTKALLAISCLVRGYPPALIQLRQQDGPKLLIRLLAQPEPRLQRKCLQVLQYMLRVVPLDRLPACEAGLVPALSSALESEDSGVREAALAAAQQLAADNDCLRILQQASTGCIACFTCWRGDAAFKHGLEALLMRLDALPQDEWPAAEEEVTAAKQLSAALQRELPPPAASDEQRQQQQRPLPVAVVDDSTTSGAPAAALQLVLVPSEPQAS